MCVDFKNWKYKFRIVHLPGIGSVNVAGEHLEKAICFNASEDALRLDEKFYCYVPDDVLILDEKEIVDYIAKNIS